ncbi:MAG: erythromycin esterase family protein [Pseudomonadota bacterium]
MTDALPPYADRREAGRVLAHHRDFPQASDTEVQQLLRDAARRRLQRAIGVIYMPHSERMSHYFHTRLAAQFDAMVHIDETRALQPLVPEPQWHAGEPAQTWPSGL